MFDKTIQGPEFSQCSQFVFRQWDTPFEIVQRLESAIFSLSLDLFGVCLAQSVYDAKSQPHCVVINNPHRRFASASRRSSLVAIPT
jgi:hypothetical protein